MTQTSTQFSSAVRCFVLLTTVVGGVGLVASDAVASPAYGYSLISAGYTRGCAACHDDEATQGGLNTANKPFAQTMKGLGLTGGGNFDLFVDIVNNKLGTHDTDCDGVIDYDELMNNGDPNVASIVPSGFTAMPRPNCNDDTGSTSVGATSNSTGQGSTTTPASTTSPGSTDTPKSNAPSGSGCGVSAVSYRGGLGPVSLALLGLWWLRRRITASCP